LPSSSFFLSFQERIQILQSELSRCKAKLAANAGAEDLMLFFLGGNTESVRYVESLKEQKMSIFSYLYPFSHSNVIYSNAENRVAALEQTVSIFQDQPAELMDRMKEAFEQLADANAQLEKYRRTYGDLSTLPPDVAHLAEQLRKKEEDLEILRMSVTQQTEVFFFNLISIQYL
jgi:E3 ubiquitin-protein ligase BRE1